jgi:hypothetical protein
MASIKGQWSDFNADSGPSSVIIHPDLSGKLRMNDYCHLFIGMMSEFYYIFCGCERKPAKVGCVTNNIIHYISQKLAAIRPS